MIVNIYTLLWLGGFIFRVVGGINILKSSESLKICKPPFSALIKLEIIIFNIHFFLGGGVSNIICLHKVFLTDQERIPCKKLLSYLPYKLISMLAWFSFNLTMQDIAECSNRSNDFKYFVDWTSSSQICIDKPGLKH